MLRWTFPYLFFISLSALFSGVLNSYNKFALPAYTQVIMNIVMIIVTVWIAPKARTRYGARHGRVRERHAAAGLPVARRHQARAVPRPRWKPAAEACAASAS
jgi:putative peptidoglycan lipid II flippase